MQGIVGKTQLIERSWADGLWDPNVVSWRETGGGIQMEFGLSARRGVRGVEK